MEILVGEFYSIIRRIGAGSFGEIFLGIDKRTNEEVAIKFEPEKCRSPQLLYESKLYLILSSGIQIPRYIWFGNESNYNIFVMELMGKSLGDLFDLCGKKFSLKTVLMIVDQSLTVIEYIHNKNFIHRDIKPDNFLIGGGNRRNQIFMIDFGLSKKYCDPVSQQHIRFSSGKSLSGTARYASISAMAGNEQSRRDDMESLGYVWLYFLLGALPWMKIQKDMQSDKFQEIQDIKMGSAICDLCADSPKEFALYMEAVKSLNFEERPHYSEYRELFRNLFIGNDFVYDYEYEWNNKLIEKENSSVIKKKSLKSGSDILPSFFHNKLNQPKRVIKKKPKTPTAQLPPTQQGTVANGWGKFGKSK